MIQFQTTYNSGFHYAISDVHGCAYTFNALIHKINLSQHDSLFILGDSINRGKHSKKLIDTIINLQHDGYNIYPLRGNHEQFIISEYNNTNTHEFYKVCKHMKLTWLFKKNSCSQFKKKYRVFFESLPYFYSHKNFLLSHAGFDFWNDNFFDNKHAMLYLRGNMPVEKIPENTYVIHGHTPISISKIKRSINHKLPIINIDNGCVYKKQQNKGNLICLNLDTFDITIQKNID
ncbi:MAG: metallophosphoesterase [Bacteroidales bacterium]